MDGDGKENPNYLSKPTGELSKSQNKARFP